jgi:hypothetical protein
MMGLAVCPSHSLFPKFGCGPGVGAKPLRAVVEYGHSCSTIATKHQTPTSSAWRMTKDTLSRQWTGECLLMTYS